LHEAGSPFLTEKMARAKAQRRKALPRFQDLLCAFASLRETSLQKMNFKENCICLGKFN